MPLGSIGASVGLSGGEGGLGLDFGDFDAGDLTVGPIRVDAATMTGGSDLAKLVPVLVLGVVAILLLRRR